MKVGLFITTLINDITQAGYSLGFSTGSNGDVKVEITKSGNPDFYDAIHCGKPNGTREELEKDVIRALAEFRDIFSIPSVTRHSDEATHTRSEPKDGSESEDSAQRDEELDNTAAVGSRCRNTRD